MESSLDFHTAKALLEWHIDLGADEAVGDAPINRYDVPKEAPKVVKPAAAAAVVSAAVPATGPDPVAVAREMAQAAQDIEGLRAAMAAFSYCDLKNGARNLVFSGGISGAKIMVIGDAPGRDEDRQGVPFVGAEGQMLDAMFEAIGHGRENNECPIYVTSALPWRISRTGDPDGRDLAMMVPFLERHIVLANPDILVLMGNHACSALLGKKGITKLRGDWTEVLGKPALPMLHPSYMLRTPSAKRETWADLLSLQAKLRT